MRFRKWAGLAVCAGFGMFAGVGGYTFHYAKGTSYLSNDPRACVNCHVMQENYDSWAKSSHHFAASCNDCHIPHAFPQKYIAKMRNGWNHSKAFTLGNFPDPIRITPVNREILENNCLHCHENLVGDIAGHGEKPGGRIQCVSCHRAVGHVNE
ncbi:MAG: cytochrome c nitrite reductase small subunit [Candidatus Omnitrophica bacterium]|nr:cytochrome c nitrite reductase small subunit [Candidatus Omnitrophota bacterium]